MFHFLISRRLGHSVHPKRPEVWSICWGEEKKVPGDQQRVHVGGTLQAAPFVPQNTLLHLFLYLSA